MEQKINIFKTYKTSNNKRHIQLLSGTLTELTREDLSGISEIREKQFVNTSLESIYIPENIKTIGKYAFSENSNLKEVVIPKNDALVLDYSIFQNCNSLEKISLPYNLKKQSSGYTQFSSLFGGQSVLDNSSVPSSLHTVIITGGNRIPEQAFFRCSNIKTIRLSKSITWIGAYAFAGTGCDRIYYDGTKAEWENNVSCHSQAFSDYWSEQLPIYCSDGIYIKDIWS